MKKPNAISSNGSNLSLAPPTTMVQSKTEISDYEASLSQDRTRFEAFLLGMDSRVASGFGNEPEDEFEYQKLYKKLPEDIEPLMKCKSCSNTHKDDYRQ